MNLKKISISSFAMMEIFLAYAFSLMIVFFFISQPGVYHLFDGIIVLLFCYILSYRCYKIEVSSKKYSLDFDFISVFFIIIITILVWYRKVNIGFNIPTIVMWVETIIYTIVLLTIGITIGKKSGVVSFNSWKIDIKRNVVLFIILLYIAFGEEIYFRGVVFNYLNQFLGQNLLISFFLNLLYFGVTHLKNGGWPKVLISILGGIFYTLVYIRTGNIFCATFIHVASTGWVVFFKFNGKYIPVEKTEELTH